MNTTVVLVAVLIIGIIIGAAAIYIFERSQTLRLRKWLGPEYSRTVAETGDRWRPNPTRAGANKEWNVSTSSRSIRPPASVS